MARRSCKQKGEISIRRKRAIVVAAIKNAVAKLFRICIVNVHLHIVGLNSNFHFVSPQTGSGTLAFYVPHCLHTEVKLRL